MITNNVAMDEPMFGSTDNAPRTAHAPIERQEARPDNADVGLRDGVMQRLSIAVLFVALAATALAYAQTRSDSSAIGVAAIDGPGAEVR